MIIKEISTQSQDELGRYLEIVRNSKDYSPEKWKMILEYLKVNSEHKLLKYEIIEE